MIKYFITLEVWRAMAKMNEKKPSSFGYVAPGVYAMPNTGVRTMYVHSTLDEAILQYKYVTGLKGGKDMRKKFITVPDTGNNTAKGLFVSVDFYIYVQALGIVPVSYAAVKEQINKIRFLIIKGYSVSNGNPYYAILDLKSLGITATKVGDYSAKKIDALDNLHRELQISKVKYNALADYVSTLKKPNMSSLEIDLYKEALLKQATMKANLKALNISNIGYGIKKDSIGNPLIVVYIVAIIVMGVVAAYSIEKILEYLKECKRINEDNDIVKFGEEQKLKIALACKAGLLTPEQCKDLNISVDKMQDNAEKDKKEASAPKDDIFSKIQNILLIGGAFYIGSKFIKQR